MSRSQTAQRYDEPSKNTHHNSGVLNIQRNGMEALGSSGGALGELWGALESSGGALRSSGGSLTKIKTKSHIHFEFLADPSLIKKISQTPDRPPLEAVMLIIEKTII